MKICGIIAEYNPFHKGHYHQMHQAREKSNADILAIVMSGMFVQRGTPAIIDKFNRAKMAVHAGADIVIELPVCYALQPAEYFALGGIQILDGINASKVSYGTEAISPSQRATIDDYINIQIKNSPEYKKNIKNHIEKGKPFFTAKISAYSDVTGNNETDILSKPNAILETAYRLAINTLNSNITPLSVDRLGDEYHAENPNNDVTSATAIRKLINNSEDFNKYVPKTTYELLQTCDIAYDATSKIYDYFLHAAFVANRFDNLNKIPDGSQEISNRIISAVQNSNNYNEFIENATTRRITRARINRAMIHLILSIESSLINDIRKYLPVYARVLALSKNGQKALGTITKSAKIPVVTSLAKYNPPTKLHKELMDIDILASNIYSYACINSPSYNQDFTTKLFIDN